MVGAASISYGGYEFARAASTSLLISELGASYMPPALVAVALVAYVLVTSYRSFLTTHGPRNALIVSAVGIAMFFLTSVLLLLLNPDPTSITRKFVVFSVFVVRQSYVTFLSSQQFSFIVSLLESNPNSLGPIYGCSSLVSAVAAAGASIVVSPVVSLVIASGALLLSACVADVAYSRAAKNVSVAHRLQQHRGAKSNGSGGVASPVTNTTTNATINATTTTTTTTSFSSVFQLPAVFKEHPRLQTLFIITFLMQMIGAITNLAYSQLLETELSSKEARSQFVGRFYTVANFVSSMVQFLGLRLLVKHVGLDMLMIVQPTLIMIMISLATVNPSIWTAAATMLTMKTIEYSVFSAVKDLTYLPLSFDARFIVKEYTDVFAYRAGKMVAAVLLTLVGVVVARALDSRRLLMISLVLVVVWLGVAWRASKVSVVARVKVEAKSGEEWQ